MEGSGGLDSCGVSDAIFPLSSGESMQPIVASRGSGDLGDDILHDLDSYLEEINDRLTISRMVSDTVTKCMVNAVMEESAERIAGREAEVACLKERLHLYETGACKIGESGFSRFACTTLAEQNCAKVRLNDLRISAEKQFQILKKEIDDSNGCSLMHKLNTLSGSLGQNEMKEYAKWTLVDQNVSTLKNILNAVFEQVDNIVLMSEISLSDWQKERKFQDEIEAMVIQNSIRGFQDESERKSLEQSVLFCGGHKNNQLGKMKQLSGLRQELDALSRSLSNPEIMQVPPYMSHEDGEEWNSAKRKDHFHRKALSNHILPSNSIREANGKHDNSKNTIPGTLDPAQLKHMSNDDLIIHFKNEMTEMKRNHESFVQELTEDYFSLRREYLKETGRSSSLKKDKEFESLRKKIPEVIVTLDDILTENEKPTIHENDDIIHSLKCRIDSIVSENRKLEDMLKSKSKEIELLSSQLSSAAEELSHHSLSEANLLKQLEKLDCGLKDTMIEVSIREDIYKCIARELNGKIKCHNEDSDMESVATLVFCKIVFREAFKDAINSIQCDIEDSDMEFIIMQEMCGIIYKEAVRNAEGVIGLLKMKYEEECEQRVSLEASMIDIRKAWILEFEEKEQLKREMLFSSLMEEKKKLESMLLREKERYEVMNQEFTRLRDQANRQEILINESNGELNLVKSKLEDAMGQRFLYEDEISKVGQKLKLTIKDLKEAKEDIVMHQAIIQKKENTLSLLEAREAEHRKQIESTIVSVERLLKTATDFESRAVKTVENNNMRLEELKSQCEPLVRKANSFRTMELVYKQRLGRRYSDFQKAEAEVDLLGDEVDALLGLLEKIYIALDHYSPILQHYPGIMEVLKLIRRELSGETAKPLGQIHFL